MTITSFKQIARALKTVDEAEEFFRDRAKELGLPGVDIILSSTDAPDGVYIRISTYGRPCFKQGGGRAVTHGHAIGMERFEKVVCDAVEYLKAKRKP